MSYIANAALETTAQAIKIITDVLPNSGTLTSLAQDSTVAKTTLFNVPSKDGSGNTTIIDVIGNKTDEELGNSLMSRMYIQNTHVHSIQKVYPTLAAGITATSAAGVWTLGSFIVVVPTNTIINPFDIHAIHIGDFSANTTYELVLYSGADGAEVEIGRIRFTRTSNTNPGAIIFFMTPIIASNSQIKAKVACAAGGSATVAFSIIYHVY